MLLRNMLVVWVSICLIKQNILYCQEAPNGLVSAKELNAFAAFDFQGDVFRSGGGGTILSPLGVIVAGKDGINTGVKDGRVRLFNGTEFRVTRVHEVDSEMVFLITNKPVNGRRLLMRRSATLQEGEELVGRGPIGGSQQFSTIRGFVSQLPDFRSGTLGVQMPSTVGCVGTGLFDLNGSLVGVIYSRQKNATEFLRLWSCDLIKAKVVESFGTVWEERLAGIEFADTKISGIRKKNYGLEIGDTIKAVDGVSIESFADWLLAGAALSSQEMKQFSLEVERNGSRLTIVIP